MATEAETRATNVPEGAERSSILILVRGPFVRKSQKSTEMKRNPPKAVVSVRGTCPPKPTPGSGEERVRSPYEVDIPPSSKGLRLVDPLRS